jgi:putative nucleotidyltransferase with HDIG domain
MRWIPKDLLRDGTGRGSQMLRTLQEVPLRQPPAPATEGGGIPVEDPAQGRLAQLPPFSPVVISLLRLFDRDDVDLAEITRLISSDAAISAELLTLVNSPLFTIRVSVDDVAHAVPLVGIERTKELATALAMRAMLRDAPKTGVVRRLWRHSIATAVIAKELAPIYGVAAGVAHTAGILHDVGRMGLLSAYRDSYTEVVLHAYDNVADILAKERAVCRMDHCEAGLYLAKSWGFPAAFCQVVQHHHGSSEERGILSLVQTACALADDLEFAAVSHADRAEPNTRITGCKGNSDRDKVLSRLREIERLVFDELESLDF